MEVCVCPPEVKSRIALRVWLVERVWLVDQGMMPNIFYWM